ncbi:ImmA/IrrE family metallo-endopeptidase [Paenibacillus sp. FSL P2-0121]|uniref:ImmA/IrrE family metallo-endopeptidase n=1 Tax=Paenibacillus sp. FSL P2-0121 TaxID=2921626 RepID=UPI0030D03285
MFKHYKKTHMEEFVEELYIDNDINDPEDITIENLSTKLSIPILSAPIKSRGHETETGNRYMALDDRLSRSQQRYYFLHELCHILRHAGNQVTLPEDFVRYQEEDSDQFALYALMPFFMIDKITLSGNLNQAIDQLSYVFSVERSLAKKRYDQILRRKYEWEFTRSLSENARREVSDNMAEEKGIRFFVYYDDSGSYDGPTQMIVSVDEKTLIDYREIELPISERLPEIEQDELEGFGGVTVSQGDVICFDGKVTLQLHQLLFKHGLSKRKFVLQMRDIEMLMEKDRLLMQRFS